LIQISSVNHRAKSDDDSFIIPQYYNLIGKKHTVEAVYRSFAIKNVRELDLATGHQIMSTNLRRPARFGVVI
jgi:hypothetical protein